MKPPAGFEGAVIEGSRALADQIERALLNDEQQPLPEPHPETLWRCLFFVLHLTDRIALAQLPMPTRDSFMSGILAHLSERTDPARLHSDFAEAQRTYSVFTQLLPDKGQGTKNTLFYEFAKSVCHDRDVINPITIVLVSLRAADMFIALTQTFQDCREEND